MNTSQWPQIVVKPIEEITIPKQQQQEEEKARPQQKEENLNCPRCNSTNTKFCYYNNYSLTQPRYFCKTCRRYWTNGGSLRNIPVGGGSRKNKRPSSSSSNTPSPSSKKQDLNLSFPISTHQDFTSFSHDFSQITKMPSSSTPTTSNITTTSNTNPHHHLSHLELLNGFSGANSTSGSSRGFGSFMHVGTNFPATNNVVKISDLRNEEDMNMNNMVSYNASAGFHDHMQGLKHSSLNFTLDHHDGNIGSGGYDRNFHNRVMQESNIVDPSSGRVLFPFEDLKQQASINTSAQDVEEHDHAPSSGYWTGMLGGGSW